MDTISKDELLRLFREVVTEVVEEHPLTDEEIKWVRLAIRAEADRAEFRRAVIEKTFVGLMSALLISALGWAYAQFVLHWKP
jgi:hypothetical protein